MLPLDWGLILLGIGVGVFGWMLYWTGLVVIGGVIGAAAGAVLGYIASGFVTAAWALPVLTALGGVLGAFLGISLMHLIQLYFFFAVGASLGGGLVWQMLQLPAFAGIPELTQGWGLGLSLLIGAIAGGLLLVHFRRFIIAVVTSVVGAILIMLGLPEQYQILGGLVALVTSLAVQIGLVSHYVDQESFDTRTRHHLREHPDNPQA